MTSTESLAHGRAGPVTTTAEPPTVLDVQPPPPRASIDPVTPQSGPDSSADGDDFQERKKRGDRRSEPEDNNDQHSLGEATVLDEDNDEDELDEDELDEDAEDDAGHALAPTVSHAHDFWKFHMRPPDDDEPEDWWFASTAIPLLAATTGPLANVLSIAALVTSWRENYDPANPGIDDDGIPYDDPRWCIVLNIVSLICGFAGNLFLLFNFTRFVRYIVALPATIILWLLASGILISITSCMHIYVPPIFPQATYSQGFWHAVIAAVLYLLSALSLMLNMMGYFLGHYTQHFELTDEQRNLILQTMMFFFWLAGGGAVFAHVCGWSYVDALYFCDVTVLTVGFGDFYAPNDVGRGLVFLYSVGGIIMLGLMVSSIHRFAQEIGHNKIVRGHVERRRAQTMERSVASSFEAEKKLALENAINEARMKGARPQISAPFDPEQRTVAFDVEPSPRVPSTATGLTQRTKGQKRSMTATPLHPLRRTLSWASDRVTGPSTKGLRKVTTKNGRLVVLREEKDRFMAMRAIQSSTRRFKRYFALCMSVIAFGLLWCVGAVVFWQCEQRIQGMTYFEALYFCYVSLLTIGYGDFAPKSNAGKPFFIVWSLIAVPTMTILISDMSDTVVAAYKRGTFTLAAWTILPTKGFFRHLLDRHPHAMWVFRRVQAFSDARQERKRLDAGFPVGPGEDTCEAVAESGTVPGQAPTLEQLAEEEPDEHDLARRLAAAIRKTADHLKEPHHRPYTYEEWVEYTRLIRFSDYPVSSSSEDGDDTGAGGDSKHLEDPLDNALAADRGITDWDWIGPDSPMMSDQPEAEWVLDRLCESLDRYMHRQLPQHVRARHIAKDAQVMRDRRVSVTSSGRGQGPSIGTNTPGSPVFARRGSVLDPNLGIARASGANMASGRRGSLLSNDSRTAKPDGASPAARRGSAASLSGTVDHAISDASTPRRSNNFGTYPTTDPTAMGPALRRRQEAVENQSASSAFPNSALETSRRSSVLQSGLDYRRLAGSVSSGQRGRGRGLGISPGRIKAGPPDGGRKGGADRDSRSRSARGRIEERGLPIVERDGERDDEKVAPTPLSPESRATESSPMNGAAQVKNTEED